MVTTEEILVALKAVAIVEWGRFSIGVDPVDGLVRPPMLVWRFADPNDDAMTDICRAVNAMPGMEPWHFDASPRNWTLMPEALRRRFAMHAGSASLNVVTDFRRANQPLCERATSELEQFISALLASPAG